MNVREKNSRVSKPIKEHLGDEIDREWWIDRQEKEFEKATNGARSPSTERRQGGKKVVRRETCGGGERERT